jgi:hypothetical protein
MVYSPKKHQALTKVALLKEKGTEKSLTWENCGLPKRNEQGVISR